MSRASSWPLATGPTASTRCPLAGAAPAEGGAAAELSTAWSACCVVMADRLRPARLALPAALAPSALPAPAAPTATGVALPAMSSANRAMARPRPETRRARRGPGFLLSTRMSMSARLGRSCGRTREQPGKPPGTLSASPHPAPPELHALRDRDAQQAQAGREDAQRQRGQREPAVPDGRLGRQHRAVLVEGGERAGPLEQ